MPRRPSPMALFDLDGTLCDTFEVDDECYRGVAAELLGVPVAEVGWDEAPHVTDGGIARWLWQRHVGRPPDDGEIAAFVAAFEAALARALRRSPDRFAAVRGAAELLESLADGGWGVGIATGGWGRTARLKLRAAGISPGLLLASSDDAAARAEIFALAHARARGPGSQPPGRTVLVGDGVWDARVAAQLGWSFLGVGRGDRGTRLQAAGATHVVPDFAHLQGTLAALQGCGVPGAPA